jgi:hypothetical protein
MTDIVNELRANAEWCHRVTGASVRHHLSSRAANEIEMLREQLAARPICHPWAGWSTEGTCLYCVEDSK